MERCLDCNSLLTRQETVCIECGTKVKSDDARTADFLASIVNLLFYLSVLTMIVSPFVDRFPSFTFCAFITSALLFMSRSAKECVQKVRRK